MALGVNRASSEGDEGCEAGRHKDRESATVLKAFKDASVISGGFSDGDNEERRALVTEHANSGLI